MAKRKTQKGPSWFEVGLGAFLSVVLGLVLGVAYMVAKPVQAVKEIPKDAPAGAVYYIEGVRDFDKTEDVEDKRKRFLGGDSIEMQEGEVNVLLGNADRPASASKPADKGPPAAPPMFDTGSLNVRIRDGKIQFGAPVNYNVFTVMGAVTVHSSGTFEKRGSEFTFVPDTLYVGGCNLVHIPFAREWVMGRLLFARPIPDDIGAAWSKLIAVSIDGNTLRLRMP
jgi:hypothetical protein